MFKKFFGSIFILFFFLGTLHAADITDLEGITGKIGSEDVQWVDSTGIPTFSVPTYDGGTITLNKVPTAPWVDVRSYSSLAAAVASAGTANKTIVIPNTQTLTGDLIIPSTRGLKILQGGSIVHTHPFTLTINGPFEAGLYQVFSGFSAGDVTFGTGSVKEIREQWFNLDLNSTAYGIDAFYHNTIGTDNVAMGVNALHANTIGTKNIAIGVESLFSNTAGSWNIGIGRHALYGLTIGTSNVAIGDEALFSSTDAEDNIAIGRNALHDNIGGSQNVVVGMEAGRGNTTGRDNTAVGLSALRLNTVSDANTALGMSALFNNTASNNTAVGRYCLINNTTGHENTAIGVDALYYNTTASDNVAVGHEALLTNTIGAQNAAVGSKSLRSNSIGNYNAALGEFALYSNTTGTNNTAVGHSAGYNTGVALETMSNCTFLGRDANSTVGGITNSTALGYGAQVTATNQVQMGNSAAEIFGFGLQKMSWGSVPPVTGSWRIGDVIWNTAPASGGLIPNGWRCDHSGTFSAATDATGDTDGSTAVITGMTDTSDFFVGNYVDVSAGFAGTGPYRVLALTITTMTLEIASNAVVANITVSTSDPTFVSMGVLP